jgi:hypothetical protein
MIYTTLNRIRAHSPCANGWQRLLNHLGKTKADDEPLAKATILKSNGVDDALWCLRAEPQHAAIWRLLAVHYARQVQHLITDPRSIATVDVAERYSYGLATDAELNAAAEAAALFSERGAARAAARGATWSTALSKSWVAAWDAAWESSSAEAYNEAGDVAGATAWDAARTKARKKQAADLMIVLDHYEAGPGESITGWKGMK